MMYRKAILFEDKDIAYQIMATKDPKKTKSLGRQISGFDAKKWDPVKESVVEEGNWYKFHNCKDDPGLGQKLLDTGNRELVEVSLKTREPIGREDLDFVTETC